MMDMDGGIVCYVLSQNFKQSDRIQLMDLHLSDTIDQLKSEVAKHTDIPIKDFVVVFHGKYLNEDDTLESNGVKHGMTLHLLPKPQTQPSITLAAGRSEIELEHLALTLKASMRSSSFRHSFQMFLKPNVFENIIVSTPGLADDPIAIACLQDADLLAQFTDVATLQKAVQSHPSLVEAISHVVANIFDSNSQVRQSNSGENTLPLAYSYLMDPSDDDDDDSQTDVASSSGTSQTPNNFENSSAAGASFSAITPAQLASALAAVTSPHLTPASSSSFNPTASSTPSVGTSASEGQLISNELFSQAIQQAIGIASQGQIQQLRDMGITNDALSLRALQMTGGDVPAALELIFELQQHERENM